MSIPSETRPTSLRRNALANVLARSVSALLWVVVTPFALSRLGAERFGVWSLFFVFGGYVASLDLGMAGASSRYIAVALARGDRAAARAVFRRTLRLSAIAGLVSCLALIVLRGLFVRIFHIPSTIAPEVERSLWVFALSLWVLALSQAYQSSLMGIQRLDLSSLFFLAGLAVNATVLVLGLALGGGLLAAAAAIAAGQGVSALLGAVAVHRAMGVPPAFESPSPVSWRELLGFSGAIQTTNALGGVFVQAGKVLLGMMGGMASVTQFELGFRVANGLWAIPMLVMGPVIPAAARASVGEGTEELRRIYGWACRWMFALAGFVLAGLWLAAPPLIMVWLGAGHGASVSVARLLAIAFACGTLAFPATAVARGGGWPILETSMYAVALAIYVMLGLWLVPRFGIQGAAITMAVSYAISGVGLILTLHRRIAVRTGEWLAKVALPRLLLPAIAATLVWAMARGWPVETRAEAVRVLVIESILFLLLAVGFSWSTGDPGVVWTWLRVGVLRAGQARRAAREIR